jgi:hypothetical protein
MKTFLLRTSMIAMLAVVSVIASSAAPLRADIPFDFILGKKTMPAGPYLVDHSLSGGTLIIRASNQKASAVVGTTTLNSVDYSEGKLVFHRYGDQYFLAEVWTPGSDAGRKLPQSSLERELSAQQPTPTVPTAVALR